MSISINAVAKVCGLAALWLVPMAVAADPSAVQFPAFEGTVIPITQPVPVRYGSFEAEETLRVRFESESEGGGTMAYKVFRRTQRKGDELIQEIQIRDLDLPEGKIPRKEMKQLTSLRFVIRSDALGEILDFDIEGLSAVRPDMSQAEADEALAELRAMAKSLPPLASKAVKTGDALMHMTTWDNASGDDVEMAAFPKTPVPFVVAGHGFFGGTKVLVTTLLADLPMLIPPEEGKGSITMGGTLSTTRPPWRRSSPKF